jgi:hypothetical protein
MAGNKGSEYNEAQSKVQEFSSPWKGFLLAFCGRKHGSGKILNNCNDAISLFFYPHINYLSNRILKSVFHTSGQSPQNARRIKKCIIARSGALAPQRGNLLCEWKNKSNHCTE